MMLDSQDQKERIQSAKSSVKGEIDPVSLDVDENFTENKVEEVVAEPDEPKEPEMDFVDVDINSPREGQDEEVDKLDEEEN